MVFYVACAAYYVCIYKSTYKKDRDNLTGQVVGMSNRDKFNETLPNGFHTNCMRRPLMDGEIYV